MTRPAMVLLCPISVASVLAIPFFDLKARSEQRRSPPGDPRHVHANRRGALALETQQFVITDFDALFQPPRRGGETEQMRARKSTIHVARRSNRAAARSVRGTALPLMPSNHILSTRRSAREGAQRADSLEHRRPACREQVANG